MRTENELQSMIGKTVTFICGPGESSEVEFTNNMGKIKMVKISQWGTSYDVEMETGDSKGTVTNVQSFRTSPGIGAYLKD